MEAPTSEDLNPFEHRGVVTTVSEAGKAVVQFERTVRCGSCCACAARNTGPMVTEVDAVPGLEPGDTVMVLMDPKGVWRGTLWTFVLPVVGLIAGAVLGWHLKGIQRAVGITADVAAGLGALILMAAVFAVGVLVNRRIARTESCQSRIVRVL